MMEADGNTRTIGYDVRLGDKVQRDSEEKNGGVDRQNKNTRPAGAETIEDDEMKDDDLERYRSYGRNEEDDAMKENEWKADAGIEEDERMMAVTRRKIARIQMEREEAKIRIKAYKSRGYGSHKESEKKDMNRLEEENKFWGDLGSIREMMHGCEYGGKRIWDDISGKELDWNGVLKARIEELEGFKKYKVYEK